MLKKQKYRGVCKMSITEKGKEFKEIEEKIFREVCAIGCAKIKEILEAISIYTILFCQGELRVFLIFYLKNRNFTLTI